jgi:hypothetical protein
MSVFIAKKNNNKKPILNTFFNWILRTIYIINAIYRRFKWKLCWLIAVFFHQLKLFCSLKKNFFVLFMDIKRKYQIFEIVTLRLRHLKTQIKRQISVPTKAQTEDVWRTDTQNNILTIVTFCWHFLFIISCCFDNLRIRVSLFFLNFFVTPIQFLLLQIYQQMG